MGDRYRALPGKTPQDILNEEGVEMLDSEKLRDWPKGAEEPVLVMFAAPWCEVCLAAAPAFAAACEAAKDRVAARHVDTDRAAAATERLGIGSVPTVVLFARDKEIARRVELSTADELQGFIERAIEEIQTDESSPDGAETDDDDAKTETGAGD